MVHLVRSSFAEKFRGLTLITAVRTASDSRMIRPIMKHGSARSEEPRRRRRPLNRADTRRVGRCAFDYRAMPGLAAGALMPSSDNPARRTLNRYVALVCVIVSTLGVLVFAYAINV